MSDTLPAAAPGLPETSIFDRRSFLATLAAAGVMTGNIEAHALTADNPDAALLELGATMEEQREALRTAGARSDAAYAILPEAPDLPSVCWIKKGDGAAWPSGNPVQWMDSKHGLVRGWDGLAGADVLRRYLANTVDLAEPLAYFRNRAKEILAAIAERDAAISRNEQVCGVTAANAEENAVRDVMNATLLRIAATPARTMPGLLIKARAAAYYRCDPQDGAGAYFGTARCSLSHDLEEESRSRLADLRPLEMSLCLDVMTMAFGSSPAEAA